MPHRPAAPARGSEVALEDRKAELRARAREARTQRSERRIGEASAALADHVMELPQVTEASCVSVYASRRSEPGTLPLMLRLKERGVRVLVPLLGDGLARGWADFTNSEDLIERAPGRPPEPSGPFLDSDALAAADVIVVPALGVDTRGTRLGQGGGWYDRALVHARDDALVVALVYDDEIHDATVAPLPREPHDLPAHAAVSPSGLTTLEA